MIGVVASSILSEERETLRKKEKLPWMKNEKREMVRERERESEIYIIIKN